MSAAEQLNSVSTRAFTCFALLPPELQDKIWNDAIQNRYAESLAHFFTLRKYDCHTQFALFDIARTADRFWWYDRTHFGPPLPPSPSSLLTHANAEPEDVNHTSSTEVQNLWDHPSNKSGYILDSGLWGACAASYQAMVRNWRAYHPVTCCDIVHQDSPDYCMCFYGNIWRGYDDPKYGSFSVSKNPYQVAVVRVPQGRWIVTRPEMDLFVCHAPQLKEFEGFELDFSATAWGRSWQCNNIALYFDPRWALEMVTIWEDDDISSSDSWEHIMSLKTDFGGFARQFDGMEQWGPRSLWLIDQRLEPLRGVLYGDLIKDRSVFKSRGHEFIEVTAEDRGRTWTTNGGPDFAAISDADERQRQSLKLVHVFLKELHDSIKDHYWKHLLDSLDFSWPEPRIEYSRYGQDYANMRPMVLACLGDGVMGHSTL